MVETAVNGGVDVIASSTNIADMVAGARRFGIAVERPVMVVRRIKA